MDKKQILIEVLGGKKFKRMPLSSKVYYFHFSWTEKGGLQVLHGDDNTMMGRGLFDARVFEDNGDLILSFDNLQYSVSYITISLNRNVKAELGLIDKNSKEEFRIVEVEEITY